MNDREKKILGFAGWEFVEFEGHEQRWTYPDGKEGAWVSPSGERYCDPPVIDLNFLAEHVFPKFINEDMSISLHMLQTDEPINIISIVGKKGETRGWSRGKQLLEACLQAVEQAIG